MKFQPLRVHRRDNRSQGFSLMEMILVVAIIMLIASILIPHLINAVHKAKQRRSMADLDSVGKAWMSWVTDQVGAASAGAAKTYETDGFVNVTYAELFNYLHPSSTFFYMDRIPDVDGWGSMIAFYRNPAIASDNQVMICSSARDGVLDACDPTEPIEIGPFYATDFDQDIIWADGFFLRWPEKGRDE